MPRLPSLVVIGLLLTTAAHAQSTGKAAEAEAIGFIKPCRQANPADVIACRQNQWLFVETYVVAKAGSPAAMLQVAGYFDPGNGAGEKAAALSIPENDIESCAWRILNARRTHGAAAFPQAAADFSTQTICRATSPQDYGAAFARARQLAQDSGNATDPPAGWQPHIPWIARNPLAADLTAVRP